MQDEKTQAIQAMIKESIKKHPFEIKFGGLRSAQEQRLEPLDLMIHISRPQDENAAYTVVHGKSRQSPSSSSSTVPLDWRGISFK